MSISLGGLASGLDTEAIVARLMEVERQPLSRVTIAQRQAQARQDILRDIQSKLRTLRDAAAGLRATSNWQDVQEVTSSSAATVGARRTGAAGIGTYALEVVALARAEQRSYAWTDSGNDRTLTVTPAPAGSSTWSMTVTGGMTAQQTADAINADTTAPVYAVAVTQPDSSVRLVLSSRTTGATSGFSSTGLTEVAGTARLAADASIKVDGGAAQSFSSNVVTSAIPGVELSLKATGTSSVSVGAPAPDPEAVVNAAKKFVSAYNDVVDSVRSRLTEKRVASPQTMADQLKGLFQGDTGLSGILSGLRLDITTAVSGPAGTRDELREIGITTGAASGSATFDPSAVAGKLVLDEAALRSALASDRTNVQKLLGASGSGFSQRFETLVNGHVNSGGTVDGRITGAASELDRLRTRQAEIERRLTTTEARLKRQFAALESAMSNSQTQQQWLSAQLARL